MSTIGRLQAAFAAATSEVIVTAANLNFDFTLIKCDAPPEYQPLGNMLAAARKSNAETGSTHVTARRLGALFEGACPPTPNLLKAYGSRISQISAATSQPHSSEYPESMFSTYAGIDGTSIWAAATSSKAALHVHLLACMIARVFEAPEAVSIWVELAKERQRDIATKFESGAQLPFSLTAAAAQNSIPKSQLAEWDASARAWLRTADEVKKSEYSQLRALLADIKTNVNDETSVFPSVMEAWRSALITMENLVSGQPQAVRDGSTLLALSSWHLYPNIAVFGSHNFEVVMDDPLISPGGVLSIGISPPKSASDAGVFWCLSLAHVRHYGKPVRTERSLQADPTRLAFPQFLLCALGALTGLWEIPSKDIQVTMKFLATIATSLEERSNAKWLTAIGRTASSYLSAEGEELKTADKLIQYGRRRAKDFVPKDNSNFKPEAHFGLAGSRVLMSCFLDHEKRIAFLRSKMSEFSQEDGRRPIDFLIRYSADYGRAQGSVGLRPARSSGEEGDEASMHNDPTLDERRWQDGDTGRNASYLPDSDTEDEEEVTQDTACYATVMRGWHAPLSRLTQSPALSARRKFAASHHRWVSESTSHEWTPEGELSHKLCSHHLTPGLTTFKIADPSGATEHYLYLCGDTDTAAVFARSMAKPASPNFTLQDFFSCIEAGYLSEAKLVAHMSHGSLQIFELLQALTTAASIYKHIPNATVAIQTLQRPILQSKWHTTPLHGESKMERRLLKRKLALAVVAYFDSGTSDLAPADMDNVMAVSSGDSIYVPSQLVSDPMERLKPRQLKRILGNFGKPGVVLLIPPQQPMMRELDYRKVMSLSMGQFDGGKVNSFRRTSLHLSFTGHHVPVYDTSVKVGQDSQVSVIESVVSVHDCGEWVADINILDAINFDFVFRLPPQSPCSHSRDTNAESGVFSVDSWDDVLDCPEDKFVVRAHGNWLARLAATAVLAQVLKPRKNAKITVCQPDTCWHCLWSEHRLGGPLLHGFIY